MTRRTETIPSDYFDQLYTSNPDPWRFQSSPYERDKYAATLAALTKPHYGRALEVGCSIGIFTDALAEHCAALLAIDASAVALDAARIRCAGHPHATFETRMIPHQFPSGPFDLIVVSEVLYYLSPADLAVAAVRCAEALSPGGELILCHWLGETDYPLAGAEASRLFSQTALMRLQDHQILNDVTYRLERYVRPGA